MRIEGVDSLDRAVYDLDLATVHVTKIEDKDSAGFGISFDYGKISLVTKGENSEQLPAQTGAFGWNVASKQVNQLLHGEHRTPAIARAP